MGIFCSPLHRLRCGKISNLNLCNRLVIVLAWSLRLSLSDYSLDKILQNNQNVNCCFWKLEIYHKHGLICSCSNQNVAASGIIEFMSMRRFSKHNRFLTTSLSSIIIARSFIFTRQWTNSDRIKGKWNFISKNPCTWKTTYELV